MMSLQQLSPSQLRSITKTFRAKIAQQAVALPSACPEVVPPDGKLWFCIVDEIHGPTKRETPSILQIQNAVCRHFNIGRPDLISSRRPEFLAVPRQIACYLARELTPASFPQIGRMMGGRDHTTAMHSVAKVKAALTTDWVLARHVDEIRRAVIGDQPQ